ncbi:MAG: transporter substrate-binding domain-containing protein [Anaerolineae bacterium]|nr:transporter substrate-binding domain-containing protein [Anaerolineae bacterium]
MKRSLLRAVLIALLIPTLAGCAPYTTPPVEPTLTPPPTPFPADVPALARIQARGHLVVGIRYDLPPFCAVTDAGSVDGFDLDLGRELARRWLGDPAAVQFRQVRSDTAADHLRAGEVDLVLAALVHTQPLEEQVDFGPTYFWDGHAILVRAGDAVSITAPGDLVGRSVAVAEDSGVEDMLLGMGVPSSTIQVHATFDQAVTAFDQRQVEAVSDLRHRLVRTLTTRPDTLIVGQYTSAPVAAAYAPNQPGLGDLIRFTFWDMFSDGTFATLYARWFPGDPVPTFQIPPGAGSLTLPEAAAVPAAPNTIAAIQSGGWVRVAMVTDRAPFTYVDANGIPTGYEVQLVQAMVEQWVGDRTAVEFIPVSIEQGLGMVARSEVDMLIGAVSHTRDAEMLVDFGPTVYVGGQGLMVLAGSAPEGIAGLNGQSVAAISGTNSADVLRRVGQDAGISVVVLPKASLDEAIAALLAGEVIAIVGERVTMLGPAYATPGLGVTADRLTQRPLAFALPPGDSAFQDLVGLTLQAMAIDGRLEAIYTAWFDDAPPQIEPWPGEPVYPLRIEVTAPYTATLAP